ncbi:MAG: ABC transporter permease [Candidatus Thermoplasmatota archaeon]|nr:ABC transporter permease [Candidatus Thermoplasmatota archaeon]
MNFRFIIADVKANFKQWIRSKGTVFWTLLFPILLILIFGSIFSGSGDTSYSLIIQNMDDTVHSSMFLDQLENISMIKIEEIDQSENISLYMQEHGYASGLRIPSDFGESIQQSPMNSSLSSLLTFYVDPSQQTTTSIVQTIVSSTLQEYNLALSGGRHVVSLQQEEIIANDFSFIDYFVPGMIGFTIMTSCIYGSIERNTKFRKDGILRKMQTMPVSQMDWILAKMLFMLFLSFLSTSVILLFGLVVWGLQIHITIFSILIIIATSLLFSGMGMIIGRFVKEEETADMAGGAITFPMMFLSGTFFPFEQMPSYLQVIAQGLPLYYVNEALRNTMIYADMDKTIYFTAFVLLFAIVFFLVGVMVTKWKED